MKVANPPQFCTSSPPPTLCTSNIHTFRCAELRPQHVWSYLFMHVCVGWRWRGCGTRQQYSNEGRCLGQLVHTGVAATSSCHCCCNDDYNHNCDCTTAAKAVFFVPYPVSSWGCCPCHPTLITMVAKCPVLHSYPIIKTSAIWSLSTCVNLITNYSL